MRNIRQQEIQDTFNSDYVYDPSRPIALEPRSKLNREKLLSLRKIISFITTFILIGITVTLGALVIKKYIKNRYWYNDNKVYSTTSPRSTISGEFVPQTSCGVPSIEPSIDGSNLNTNFGKIINGQVAVAHSWPWIVSLRLIKNGYLTTHVCGASLIYENFVITAAHCVYGYRASDLAIVIGVSSFASSISMKNVYYVSDMMYHSKFNSKDISNDIAVLKLAKNVQLSDTVSTICLPSLGKQTDIYDKYVVTAGWGSTTGVNSANSLSKELLQLILHVRNGDFVCYGSNSNYCTLGKSADSNTCYGDSGGPLMYWSDGKWYLYGLTSFIMAEGTNCVTSYPSYYTIVPNYLDWISNTIATLSV